MVADTFFNSSLVLLPLVFGLWCRSKKLSNTQQELRQRSRTKQSREIHFCQSVEHVERMGIGLGLSNNLRSTLNLIKVRLQMFP